MKHLVDMATSKALMHWMNGQLVDFVEVTFVKLDSWAASCKVTFVPHGEEAEVELIIAPYALVTSEDGYQVKAEVVTCSRIWLESLATRFLVGNEYSVPAIFARLI